MGKGYQPSSIRSGANQKKKIKKYVSNYQKEQQAINESNAALLAEARDWQRKEKFIQKYSEKTPSRMKQIIDKNIPLVVQKKKSQWRAPIMGALAALITGGGIAYKTMKQSNNDLPLSIESQRQLTISAIIKEIASEYIKFKPVDASLLKQLQQQYTGEDILSVLDQLKPYLTKESSPDVVDEIYKIILPNRIIKF